MNVLNLFEASEGDQARTFGAERLHRTTLVAPAGWYQYVTPAAPRPAVGDFDEKAGVEGSWRLGGAVKGYDGDDGVQACVYTGRDAAKQALAALQA